MAHAIEKESGLNKPRMPKLESWLKNINQLSPRGRWSQMRCANWIVTEVCYPPAIDKMLMGRLTAHSEYSHTCPSDLARVQAGTEYQSVSPLSCFPWAARLALQLRECCVPRAYIYPPFRGSPATQTMAFPNKGHKQTQKGMICRQRGRLAGWGVPRLELAAGCLAIQCSPLEGREQRVFVCLFVLFLFDFTYLLTFVILILSRFSQVKWECLWVKNFDRCPQPKSISRNIWWTRNNALHPQFHEYFFKVKRVKLNQRNIKKRFSISGICYSECICWHLSRGSQMTAAKKWKLGLDFWIQKSPTVESVNQFCVCVYIEIEHFKQNMEE